MSNSSGTPVAYGRNVIAMTAAAHEVSPYTTYDIFDGLDAREEYLSMQMDALGHVASQIGVSEMHAMYPSYCA